MGVEQASDQSRDEVLSQGFVSEWVDGTATIVQLQATGKNVNMQRELLFELVLEVGGRQSTINHIQAISPELIGRLRPGARVPVKVDPDDHSHLTIA